MANTTKNMQQIRHILQLRAKKVSIREIKNATGVSRPTIRIYLNRWDAMGLPWDHLASLDDEALAAILYQEPQSAMDREGLDDLQVRIPKMLKDLSKTGVTRQLLWQEYRLQRPEGYGYTQFCEYLGGAAHRSKAVMHFEHKAGERLMIDFAGKKLHYVDPESGEQIACEVFLAVLPFSGYCYVEAVHSQRLEDFLGAIANAFAYLNGVTQAALIDNLKSGVIKPDRYEPKLTELLEQLSAHYGCTFMATRVAKPRDKASVERHVQIVYQRVYAPLRNETFTSLRGLNSAIAERLAAHHALPFQQRRTNAYTTVAEHMPPNHQHHATIKGYSAQYFLERASRTGPACQEVARRIHSLNIVYQ